VDLSDPLDPNRTATNKREGCSPARARVPAKFTGEAALVQTPTGSDGFQMTAMVGRGTGGHGGLDGGDGALDCFQKREGEVAGAAMGSGVLRPLVGRVDLLQIRR
jgi:hypothetical protein